MGYLHIDNLYKNQDILLFKECWALEKVHGTSTHLTWKTERGTVGFFAGGESHGRFVSLFDVPTLTTRFQALDMAAPLTIHGEAYGGRQQGMGHTYGPNLHFIAFDVQIGARWLSVEDMAQVAGGLGLEVVPYTRVPATVEALDAERDRPSEVAARRGMGADKPREGIVVRPLIELTKNNDTRIIAKHKNDSFAERATPQKIVDPAKLQVLADAQAIAAEWVTPMRLAHVLQQLPGAGIEQLGGIIRTMVEDVEREARNEIVESHEAHRAIARRTAELFKQGMRLR